MGVAEEAAGAAPTGMQPGTWLPLLALTSAALSLMSLQDAGRHLKGEVQRFQNWQQLLSASGRK